MTETWRNLLERKALLGELAVAAMHIPQERGNDVGDTEPRERLNETFADSDVGARLGTRRTPDPRSRMRQLRTSGSEGGRGGNSPVYPTIPFERPDGRDTAAAYTRFGSPGKHAGRQKSTI